jgi:hypothetical protein
MKYLESANASSFDNFNIDNLYLAFEELENSDEEHGAFWVVDEKENVLEIHKDLKLIAIFPENSKNQITKQLKSIDEAKKIFVEFMNGDIEKLMSEILYK